MKHIGQNIRKLRELRNYTQKYVASQLNMTQGNYARIENEEIQLSEERLQRIAEILECRKQEIIHFNTEEIFEQDKFNKKEAPGTSGDTNDIYYLRISPELKKLYEDHIRFLEDYIQELRSEIKKSNRE